MANLNRDEIGGGRNGQTLVGKIGRSLSEVHERGKRGNLDEGNDVNTLLFILFV